MLLFKPKMIAGAPYGAFELKVWYQSNMLSASVVTAIAVTLIWGGIVIYQYATAIDLDSIPVTTIESIMDLGPPPSIVQKPPQIEIAKPKLAQPKVGIPKPVADDEILDEEVVLATKEELAQINVSEMDFGDEGMVVNIQDILPNPGDFVKVEVQPDFAVKVAPEYPRIAKTAGMEGIVWVKILVDKDGQVRDAIIAKASGANAGFEEAALDAAKKCTFTPAIQNGRPIAIWVTFPFKFELNSR